MHVHEQKVCRTSIASNILQRKTQGSWDRRKMVNTYAKSKTKRHVCPELNDAILKYGKDAFIREKLIDCKTRDELNSQEIYWIIT